MRRTVATKLVGFGLVVAASFGLGAAIGAAVGPIDVGPQQEPAEADHDTSHDTSHEVKVEMSASHDLAEQTLDLRIGGMTCASCATRVERQLNDLEGYEQLSTWRRSRRTSWRLRMSTLPAWSGRSKRWVTRRVSARTSLPGTTTVATRASDHCACGCSSQQPWRCP